MTGQRQRLLGQTTSTIKVILFVGTALATACQVSTAQTTSANQPADSKFSVRA
jgi:hypothetical protein